MAYNKTKWIDQDVENPRTYTQRKNDDGSITLLDHFGTITELGTPVNAENMNKIEDGIAAAVEKSSIKQDLSTPSADTVLSTEGAANESSRIVSIMDSELAKRLKVNERTTGDYTALETPKLNSGNQSDVYLTGYAYTSTVGNNLTYCAPALLTNNVLWNRLGVHKKINNIDYIKELGIGVDAQGYVHTKCDASNEDNSIVTTISHGSRFMRFGNGLQICWGAGTGVQVFPQPFRDTDYMIADSDLTYHKYEGMWTANKTTTQFEVKNSGFAQWIAIGYWY